MPNLTPLEAAEKLEEMAEIGKDHSALVLGVHDDRMLALAASYLRKIASGEYALVVYGHWINDGSGHYCSNCKGYITNSQWTVYKNPHCPYCGALMDGKDDIVEKLKTV